MSSQLRQKILVVDDEPGNIAMLRNALLADYKIFFALNGQDALDSVASPNRPDLILLDILMPGMNGFEVCKRLKASREFHEIPIIFITAKNEVEIETKGLELGAVDFITKPFNPPVVKARVQTHLNLINTFAQLKDRESHLRSILEAAMDAIITTDQNGLVVDFNPFAETLFGYSRQEVIGRDIADLIVPPEFRAQHREGMKRYVESLRSDRTRPLKRRLELNGLCANGGRVNLEVALIATHRQNQLHFTAFLHDITERNNLLVSLNDMLKTAEDASRAKSDFLANMSHEIRTPMNAIIGLTKLALKADLTPKVEDYLTKIENASRSMLGVINDILEFSRIEAGHMQLNPQEFNLQEVFDHLGDLFRRQTGERNIELILSLSSDITHMIGDAMRLEQVLTNLIGNALKFTERGEIVVEARLRGGEAEQALIEFAIHDTGIGIDPSRLPALFESFVQADNSITRKYGGTGLGLAICKRIVGLMGGEIWAESTPGKGSVFRFTALFIPVVQGRKERRLPETAGQVKVLLVDDQPKSREVLEEILHSFNLETTGVDGMSLAASLMIDAMESPVPYRLVVLNLRQDPGREMRVYSNLVKMLSSRYPEEALPRSILLTRTFKDECVKSLLPGINTCVEKPINRSQLFNAILEVFGFQFARNSLYHQAEVVDESNIKKNLGGVRVLVVEDNAINMQVVRELMERVGVLVEEANHGKMALRMIQNRDYAVVLMDLQMPEMDGFTVTRLIRREKRFQNLPIIAMTAHAMEEDRKKCLAAGMNGHVGKPFNPKELYDILTRWVEISPPAALAASDSARDGAGFADMPGIHVADGLARMAGDARLYRRMLARFYTDNAQDADKIAQALLAGDHALGERLAHTIKSVSGQLGAVRLNQAAMQLEKAMIGRDPNVGTLLTGFREALDEVLLSLADLAHDAQPAMEANASKPTRRDLDVTRLEKLLGHLALLLVEQDSEADALIAPLRECLHGHAAETTLNEIAEQLRHYDYENARSTLSTLAGTLGMTLAEDIQDGTP
ncbi:MAG: response regulator [Magnetococcales bacterium]|nr:response regulator [Magnetococcales bacterium]